MSVNLAVINEGAYNRLLIFINYPDSYRYYCRPVPKGIVASCNLTYASDWLYEDDFTTIGDDLESAVLASMSLHSCQDIVVYHEDYTSPIATLPDMDVYKSWVNNRKRMINYIAGFDTYHDRHYQYSRNIKIHHLPELQDQKYSNVMWLLESFWDDHRGDYLFYSTGRSGGHAVPEKDITVICEDSLEWLPDAELVYTEERLREFSDSVDDCIADFAAACDYELEKRAEQAADYTERSLWLLGITDSIITLEDDYFEGTHPKTPRKLEYKVQHRSGRIGYLFIRYTDPDEWESFDDLHTLYEDEDEAWAQPGSAAIVVKDAISIEEAYQCFKEALMEEQ